MAIELDKLGHGDMERNKIYLGDCLDYLIEIPGNSIDLVITDPPYGIGFMGKDWDRALPDKKVWKECLRVLKDGALSFVMSIPRADCLSRMIISLEDAGFNIGFTPIFWVYSSGFPKAQNIGKAVDKRLGVKREIVKTVKKCYYSGSDLDSNEGWARPSHRNPDGTAKRTMDITASASPQAKALDGSYGGFQPKPAVEVIIVAMKPLSEKTYVDQALKNRKGITWLDEGRIPFNDDKWIAPKSPRSNLGFKLSKGNEKRAEANLSGRFPANLIVSDDVLNDGRIISYDTKTRCYAGNIYDVEGFIKNNQPQAPSKYGDSGSFSRYFDLDNWWAERIKQLPESVQKTFPFLIVSKASKSEKNKGLEGIYSLKENTPDAIIKEIEKILC